MQYMGGQLYIQFIFTMTVIRFLDNLIGFAAAYLHYRKSALPFMLRRKKTRAVCAGGVNSFMGKEEETRYGGAFYKRRAPDLFSSAA
jgi:hypothetical protein